MKGLVLNAMENKKEEAEQLVKKGLMYNLRSQLSWHVHGLMYRSQHKYDDAIKCYKQALRIDPEDIKILKDTALLEVQRRMMDGYQETCRKLVVLKPKNRNNWLAYAIASHLNKKYALCFKILELFHGAFDPNNKSELGYPHSELKMYRNMVLEESGDIQGALDDLDKIENEVVDKLSLWEKRAELNLKLGNLKAAEKNYKDLINYQPETYRYYHGLRQAMGLLPGGGDKNDPSSLRPNDQHIQSRPQRRQRPEQHMDQNSELTDSQIQQLDKVFDEIMERHPKSAAPQRLRLNYCNGDAFKERINEYLVVRIRKGVPALFRDVRAFYSDSSKVKIIEDLVLGYLENLEPDLRFTKEEEEKSEPPSVYCWCLYFIGQHYDFIGQPKKAFEYVDKAIAHTPTNIDLYVLKARIFKHAGDMENGFKQIDFARRLDTADRYLNTKCVRYALRANHVKKAEEIVSLFFRDGDGLESLFEMQVMWYELSSGDSYFRQKQYGRALKQYLSIGKHFHTINEDQFDFHSYCLRKTTLRAYVDMLRWQDNLKGHKWFCRATRSAIKTYIILHDSPKKKHVDAKKTENEKKVKKQKKKNQKKTEEEEAKELENTEKPLEEATKQLESLRWFKPNEISTHILAAMIHLRKNKPLLVLKALKKAFAINRENPDIHYLAIDFWKKMEMQEDTLHSVTKTIVEDERKTDTFWKGRPLESVNEEFFKLHSNSLLGCVAYAKSLLVLEGPAAKKSAVQLVHDFSLNENTTLDQCMQVQEWLESLDEKSLTAPIIAAYSKRFPYASCFVQEFHED